MDFIISSFMPFANIAWWAAVLDSSYILFDAAEHFEKMTYRNRYNISGANGMIQLSIPLVNGRNQRTVMRDVRISNKDRWQTQHWRTLMSVYKRTPYFDYYEPSLQQLFDREFVHLIDFSRASFQWVKEQIKLDLAEQVTEQYVSEYGDKIPDLRKMRPQADKSRDIAFPHYYQLFEDRTDFLPNLSILDLLFSEGTYTLQWLKDNREELLRWLPVSMSK